MPIYLRITIQGERSEVATGRACEPNRWNSKAGRTMGTKEDSRALNSFLETLHSKVLKCHHEMLVAEETISAVSLKDRFSGKSQRVRTIIEVFEDHNQKMKALIGKDFKKATLQRYNTTLMHLKDFMKFKYGISDIPIQKINLSFLNEFEYYLRTRRKCCNNSALKYLKNFGKIVRICLGNGWLLVDPFLNYKPKIQRVNRTALTWDDLKSIEEKGFSIERLETVKDIFLFSCYTGLAYVDIKNLTKAEISLGVDGEKWIFTRRQKTDIESRIPILPKAWNIIENYQENIECQIKGVLLPILSNQKMNAYLKEIGDLCGIDKPLTFHIARHTFATTITLNNGVPIESVSKMLGHTNIKTTQHYAKLHDHKVGTDMMLLREKMNSI